MGRGRLGCGSLVAVAFISLVFGAVCGGVVGGAAIFLLIDRLSSSALLESMRIRS